MKIVHHLPKRKGLIKTLSGNEKKDIVYKRNFHYPSHTITLRPFCIETDMPVVHNWAWKPRAAADLLAASYQYTRESNFACSYMALLDGFTPVGEIDICHALKDEVCDLYPALPGDYIVRLIMPENLKPRQLPLIIVRTCLDHFFSFQQIERLVTEPDVDNKSFNQLLERAGFCYQQKIYQSYKISNLYCCTRNSILHKFTL